MIKDKKTIYIFLFFFINVFVLYYYAQNAKFVNDTFYYLYEIETTGWKGILNSYKMIFLWYVPSIGYYLIYSFSKLNWLGWHIVFSGVHSFNALMLFIILRQIFSQKSFWISFFSAYLFLISPFQTEVVAWGATFHYLLILTFLLLGFISLIHYFKNHKLFSLICYHVFFLSSLSCFEQAFLYPFLYLLFAIIILPDVFNIERTKLFKQFLNKFFLINIISIAGYFILTKITMSVWIAHYGASKHMQLHPAELLDGLINYNLKFLIFFRYQPEYIKKIISGDIFHSIMVIVTLLLGILIPIIFIYKKYYNKLSKSIIFFFLAGYVFMLVPVLNLDQSFTFEIQSDRYGYVASAFFYPFLVLILYNIRNKFYIRLAIGIEIIISIVLLFQANNLWHHAGNISMALICNFPLQPNQNGWILNLPDNYKGAYMFRNGFNEGLSVVNKMNYKSTTKEIACVNILSNENENQFEKINDSTYYIKCLKYGKWFYHSGHGAVDYSTDNYWLDFDEWNTAYTLTIKSVTDTTYLLLCEGEQWKIADTLFPKTKSRQW